jgi:isopenicillin N synthase-like dioxygenase
LTAVCVQNVPMSESVPTLDFAKVDTPGFARAIGAAYERYGFVVIGGHGIPAELTADFLDCYRAFFALPEAVKRRYHVPGAGGARGYTPFGVETAKGAVHHDLKEFWHVGRELPAGHRYLRYMPPNLWVEELPGFRHLSLAMFEAFETMGRALLRSIARWLQLANDWFEPAVNEGNSVLRVIHYPPMPPTHTQSVRAGAHEDINVITLLMGAEEPGLQVLTKQGHWLAVNPQPGSLVVNVGDMLQRLTNDALRSTTHRVVNPPRERASSARFSMPYFLHFNPDFLIETLPGCVTPERPNAYPVPITADDYLQQRLREIRLK